MKDHLINPLKLNEFLECPSFRIELARYTILASILFVADDIRPNNRAYNLACCDTRCNVGPWTPSE